MHTKNKHIEYTFIRKKNNVHAYETKYNVYKKKKNNMHTKENDIADRKKRAYI